MYRRVQHVHISICFANSPFPSCLKPLFQAEAKCEAVDMKYDFLFSRQKKTHFHKKGFALSAVLKVRVFGTSKWPNYLIIILSVTIDRLGEFGSWPCSPQLTTYL